MNFKSKNTVFLLLFFSMSFMLMAQPSNKKRVLVIPVNRFEFTSAFKLTTIAEKNKITSSAVFLTYENALLDAFRTYEDENFEFVPVDAQGIKEYKHLLSYQVGKYDGKYYNAVNLSNFTTAQFEAFLTLYQADFVVFITKYEIKKETISGIGMKRRKYATHFFDFDLYNLFKQQVVGMAKVKAESPKPTNVEGHFSLLRVQEVKVAYTNFIKKIVTQLNTPIELK